MTGRGPPQRDGRLVVVGEDATQCLAQRSGVAGLDEQAVDVVRGDVAVAIERTRDDRVPAAIASISTTPKLSPCSDGAQNARRATEAGDLSVVVDPAEPLDPPVPRVLTLEASGVGPVGGDPQTHVGG